MPFKVYKNLSENAKNWIKSGLGAIFLIAVFSLQWYLRKTDVENDKLVFERGAKTVGIYTDYMPRGRQRGRTYAYYVNNKLYWNRTTDSRLPKGIDTLAFLDEMYEVRYLPYEPEISQINFLKHFEEKELYGVETKGKIDVIHWIPSEKHWLVRYSYDKNGKEVKSKQAYQYWDTSNVKAGRRIEVIYSAFRKGKKVPEKSWIIPGKEPAE